MNTVIRPETEADHAATESLTRDAFWDKYKPGADEHLVLHQLRRSSAYVPELAYVAVADDTVVGHIAYSRAVVRDGTRATTVLCMGPFSVAPTRQHQGIGRTLLETTIAKATELGFPAIVIFGDPGYYGKYDFVDAQRHRIQTADGLNFAAFMVRILSAEAMTGITGRFVADPAFVVQKADLDEFERRFPPREKHVLPGQLHGD